MAQEGSDIKQIWFRQRADDPAAKPDKIAVYAKDDGTLYQRAANGDITELGGGGEVPVGGTPALTLGTANAAGAAATFVKTDATVLAFDATAPSTQAFGDSAAAGSAAVAARRDHKHAMPAAPKTVATDPVWDAAGDLAVGTGADTAGRLALTVPPANILEVLGVVNGETTPTWKAVHDATAPAAIGSAAAGTALTAAHRDHVHATGAGTPSTQAFGDSAATGSGPAAAMTDHKHAMPANPVTGLVETINFVIDGGGSAIAAGVKGDLLFDFAFHVVAWTLIADQTGSIVVDLWKRTDTTAPTDSDTMTGGETPTLASAVRASDTSLASGAGWAVAAGSTIRVNADATPATVTRVTLALKITRD